MALFVWVDDDEMIAVLKSLRVHGQGGRLLDGGERLVDVDAIAGLLGHDLAADEIEGPELIAIAQGFISFEHLGLAPNFRRAAQSGAVWAACGSSHAETPVITQARTAQAGMARV